MPPLNFSLPMSSTFQILVAVLWLLYLVWYWRAMVRILAASKFTSEDKILWFLVITLAPLIGLITFQVMCPTHVLNTPETSTHDLKSNL
jgi:TctA family transporter